MSLLELVAQSTHEVPCAPMREMFAALTLLPVCCVCGLIRDDTGLTPGPKRWITQRIYRKTYGMSPADVPLTHTYCVTCFTKAQETVKQYVREIGTPP